MINCQNTSTIANNKLRIKVGKSRGRLKTSSVKTEKTDVSATMNECKSSKKSTPIHSIFDSYIEVSDKCFERKYPAVPYSLENFEETTEPLHHTKEPTLKEEFLSMIPAILLGIGLAMTSCLIFTDFFRVAAQVICANKIAVFTISFFVFSFSKTYKKIRTSFYESLHRLTGKSHIKLQITFLIIRISLVANPFVLALFKAIFSA